jgi:putative transposase
MKRTVRCKIEVNKQQALSLTKTLETFAYVCNCVLAVSKESSKTRAFDLHHLCYHSLKEQTGLTSNYVVRAIARVAQSFGAKRPPTEFRPTSLDLDKDLIRYNAYNETISISSVDGRLKNIPLRIGNYQRSLLLGQNPKAGTLVHDKRKNNWYVHLIIENDTPEPTGSKPLGVDLGINRIATTSDGEPISGRSINRRRERYARTRASMQSKGTKGCKRALKRLSGKQARFTKDTNHKLSKKIVGKAKKTDSYIVVEDLEGIRERTNHKGRRLRKMIGGWSFYQLQSFIDYKASLEGIAVVKIDPAYSSKTCSECGVIGTRRKHIFCCKSCGNIADADVNAARNIALRGALVFCPEISGLAA